MSDGAPRPFASNSHRVWVALLLYLLLMVAMLDDHAPIWLGGVYVVMGALSAAVYSIDKKAAIAGAWRVQEKTLLFIDFCGGIIGGLLAQHYFRHKTKKLDFRIATWAIAVIHLGFLGGVAAGLFRFLGNS